MLSRRELMVGALGFAAPEQSRPREHRLLLVNPNTSRETTDQVLQNARRYARAGVTVSAINPDDGPRIILGRYEDQLATAAMLRKVESLSRDSFDALIVASYSDSGLYALRELLEVPVLGIAQSSMLLGSSLGYKFTILTFVERLRPFLEDLVTRYGFDERLASIRIVELRSAELRDGSGRPHPRLVEGAQSALREDGAEVILLGGSTLTGLDKVLEGEIGAPVIDGVVAAVKIAESLLDYGVRTSKVKAFMTPESKRPG